MQDKTRQNSVGAEIWEELNRTERAGEIKEIKRNKKNTHLNFRPESQEGISLVAHSENAPESILGQVSNLQYLQIWCALSQIQLLNEDIIDDNRRLLRLVEGRCEE